MDPQKCFEENIDRILSVPDDRIVKLTMPQKIAASEGQELNIVFNEDIDALAARGLDPQIKEDLPVRIAAFTYSVVLYELDFQNDSTIQSNWDTKKEEGYALKKKIVNEMEFAFRDDTEALKKLAEIKDGNSHREMLIDLLELEIIGREYSDLLTKTSFNFSLLDRAKALHEEVTRAYADMRVHSNKVNKNRVIRDKAYTWLKELMDEIRKYGKFVFSNNPERLKFYKSEYYKDIRSHSKSIKTEAEVNENSND